MQIRVMTLRYDPVLDAFDETRLVDFAKDRRILGIRDHFFETEAGPRLVLVIRSERQEVEGRDVEPAGRKSGGGRSEKWRELLTPETLPLFNTLREWRSERARRDGVPPYVICTNRQLALLVRARPQTLAGIGEVEGFGRGKLERYGSEMLEILRKAPVGPDATEDDTAGGGGVDEGGAGGDGDG